MPIIIDKPSDEGISDLWDRNAYTFANRKTSLDKIHPDATFSDVSGGIQIEVASGMLPSTSPYDTVTSFIAWDMRDSITNAIRASYTAAPGIQALWAIHFTVTGSSTQQIEISMGHTNTISAPAVGCGAGFEDGASRRTIAWRFITSTLSRTADGSPAGSAVAFSMTPTFNVGTSALILNNNFVIGLIDHDPKVMNPGSSPFDFANGAGNIALQPHLFLNVRNSSGSSLLTSATYTIKPRLLMIGWDT